MGKIGKVLKPKQHTEKHHKHIAAYQQKEQTNVQTDDLKEKKGK
jgi:hypothetical protein